MKVQKPQEYNRELSAQEVKGEASGNYANIKIVNWRPSKKFLHVQVS